MALTADGALPINSPAGADSRGAFSAVIVAALLGEYSLLIMPFIVTAMMQSYGLDESRAGQYVSLQLAAMGIAGFAASYLVSRISPRSIVLVGAILVIAANVLCATGTGGASLALGRLITGLGEGSLMAAAGAMAAGITDSHRLFSILGLVIAAVAAIALLSAPLVFQYAGARGVFWFLAISPLTSIIALPWLPQRTAASTEVHMLGALRIPGALPALFAFALMWFGASALWVYAEQIGAAQGLSLGQVGSYLAIGQVAGLLGPIFAVRFGEKIDMRCSIAVGAVLMAAASLMMVFGQRAIFYALGVSLMSIGVMFLAPCFRSLMAKLDSTGGVVAMSVAFYTAGFGIAPLVVANGNLSHGYGGVAWWGSSAFIASGAISLAIRAENLKLDS
jgi:predicted MFS family arabinose efflux permease